MSLDERWPKFFYDYGPGCTGGYQSNGYSSAIKLCCQDIRPKLLEKKDALDVTALLAVSTLEDEPITACRYCSSCGSSWSNIRGQMSLDESWGNFFKSWGDGCVGSYRTGNDPRSISLCCMTSTSCSLCTSCGGNFPLESGALSADQDWPNFFKTFGKQCNEALNIHDYWGLNGVKMCCKKEN